MLSSAESASAEQRSEYVKAHKTIKYIIDCRSLYAVNLDSGLRPIKSNGSDNVYVLMHDGKPPQKAIRLEPIRGPPKWVVERAPHIYVQVSPHAVNSDFLSDLDKQSFNKNSLRLISLFDTKAVEDAIDKSAISTCQCKLADQSNDGVEQAIAACAGKYVALLGHVEGGRFVLRSRDGQRVLIDLPVADVNKLAHKYRVTLLGLGCKAGLEASNGAVTVFNPVHVVERISFACEADTVGGVVRRLCSDELELVLNENDWNNLEDANKEFAVVKKDGVNFERLIEIGLLAILCGLQSNDDKHKDQALADAEGQVGPSLGTFADTPAVANDDDEMKSASKESVQSAPGDDQKAFFGMLGFVIIGVLVYLLCHAKR